MHLLNKMCFDLVIFNQNVINQSSSLLVYAKLLKSYSALKPTHFLQ